MPVPFDVCKGNLRFGGDALLSVQKFDLEGPLISASATGTVAKAPDFSKAPLALDVEINAQPAIRAVLQSSGLRIGRDGSARLRVTGTPAAPVVR